MSKKQAAKTVAAAVGTALAGSLAFGVASADTGASPFAMQTLAAGYMLGAGEGKCGGDKEGKGQEGKCGEGKCGGDKAGEGTCGGDKDAEGKCGEGKCGGSV